MPPSCFRRWGLALAGAVALAACRASVPTAAPGTAVGATPSSGATSGLPAAFPVARYAESVPITAIALGGAYVWAGTERGLRRWKIVGKSGAAADDADAEPIGAESGLLGHRIDALTVDDDRGVWVASEAGIGRLADKGGRLRYDWFGSLTGITLLAAGGAGAGGWAAGPSGLYRYDGHSWATFDFLRDVAVTSLDLDEDGRSVWVGTRGHGLFLVGANGGKPILMPGDGGAAEEVVGLARSPGGARVVATRASNGGRITLILKEGTEEYRTQSNTTAPFVRLVSAGAHPILIAGAPGAERPFELRPLPRGAPPATGAFRLVSVRKGSTARYQAVPMALALPPQVTVIAAAGGINEEAPVLWCGSRSMGVARAEAARPLYLSGDLTYDADRLSVACAAIDRCLVVAGGAHAWFYDGARFQETRAGESPAGRALAVAEDADRTMFSVIAEPPFRNMIVARLAPGGAGPPRDADWHTVEKVALGAVPDGSRPSISFATFAPSGKLWLGVGTVAKDDQEQGRGALEISLAPSGKATAVHHGALSPKETSAESLPLPHDLTGALFDGAATWFSSRSGIDRLQESELRHWGENEHMDSEVCFGVAKGSDGKIWAATSGGAGRFDGKEWRFTGDGPAATAARGVAADGAGRMWLATAKGLRVLDQKEASASLLAAGTLIVEDDMLDLTLDRFGRIWALGSAAIAIVDTGSPVRQAKPDQTTPDQTKPDQTSPAAAPSGGTR